MRTDILKTEDNVKATEVVLSREKGYIFSSRQTSVSKLKPSSEEVAILQSSKEYKDNLYESIKLEERSRSLLKIRENKQKSKLMQLPPLKRKFLNTTCTSQSPPSSIIK